MSKKKRQEGLAHPPEEIFVPGDSAEAFRPHQFQTEMKLMRPLPRPRILVTPGAYGDMLLIARNSGEDEIGWLGSVDELGNGKYLIRGIYLVDQKVHLATSELSEDGIAELFTQLVGEDHPDAEKIMFWGHVHPDNSTSPSTQDNAQMNLFQHNSWFIRAIFGRHGRAEFTFFDYRNGVRWNDVPWEISFPLDSSREEFWREEISRKVKKIHSVPSQGLGFGSDLYGHRQIQNFANWSGGEDYNE